MGVASGRGYRNADMASGWNLWVWLECIGVVSGCCCKEVYRYPHNNYKFSLLHLYYIALFCQQHPYFFVHFLNVFFVLVYVIFVQYTQQTLFKEYLRSFKN